MARRRDFCGSHPISAFSLQTLEERKLPYILQALSLPGTEWLIRPSWVKLHVLVFTLLSLSDSNPLFSTLLHDAQGGTLQITFISVGITRKAEPVYVYFKKLFIVRNWLMPLWRLAKQVQKSKCWAKCPQMEFLLSFSLSTLGSLSPALKSYPDHPG